MNQLLCIVIHIKINLIKAFLRLKNIFLDFLFPRACLGCGLVGPWLCHACANKIPYYSGVNCLICKDRLAVKSNGISFQKCQKCQPRPIPSCLIAATSYQHPLIQKLIRLFKYQKITELENTLGEMLINRLKNFPIDGFKIIPVPLHRARFRQRGFNQAHILAEKVAQHFNLDLCDYLERTKNTATQTGLEEKKRIQNIKNAFVAKNQEKISGISFLLIDDVATTGSTLNECARALKAAGAKEIWAAVVAK